MNNDKELTRSGALTLDAIGGERLIGSGFEEEVPDNEFTQYTPASESGER